MISRAMIVTLTLPPPPGYRVNMTDHDGITSCSRAPRPQGEIPVGPMDG